MNSPTQAAFFCQGGDDDHNLNRVYGASQRARLISRATLLPRVITSRNFDEFAPQLREIEVIFATWGLWKFSEAQLDALPRLSAVFYAAGTVRSFASPLLERGVTLVSAWAANAIPVAEWTLGQVLLANKGYFRNEREFRVPVAGRRAWSGRGNYGATVAILGAGQIGRKLIELLQSFHLKVVVFDPFLSDEAARALGVEKVDLAEAFARGDVVSNHLANLPATVGMINGALLELLKPNATFINTGRGATVNHADLIEVLTSRPDLTALLDVTNPEPLPLDSPLRELPNVHLTSHIAGSIGDEVARMGDYVLDEFEAWQSGQALRFAVTPLMLETMA
jgi:phosphoglycerate dehydrogenase-like enzyme